MAAPVFHPVYMTNETITEPIVKPTGESGQAMQHVNPQYCLTGPSAKELVKILQTSFPQYVIAEHDGPPWEEFTGAPEYFNLDVPWITITNRSSADDGSDLVYRFNAGQFSAYFASASMTQQDPPQYTNPEVAWRNATQDIGEGLVGG